jgi:hypothetical protein
MQSDRPLEPGDQVPHFSVSTALGQQVRYDRMWQHRNLVFVSVDVRRHPQYGVYASDLMARTREFAAAETELVVSPDPIQGLPAPAVMVADRWGEIVRIFTADADVPLPNADELLDWINFIRMQCPECPP